jgi:hypothetical protein
MWEVWLERAEHISNEIGQQVKFFSAADRIRLQARVGILWQGADDAKSKTWLDQAVRDFQRWNPEGPAERREATDVHRWLLSEVGVRHPDFGEELSVKLAKSCEKGRAPSPSELEANASAISRVAISLAKETPQKSYAVARLALHCGGSREVAEVVSSLITRHPELAAQVFDEALSQAEEEGNARLLGFLAYWAATGSKTSPALKARALRAYKNSIANLLTTEQDVSVRCEVASHASWLSDEIGSDQTAPLRAILAACEENPRTRLLTITGAAGLGQAPRTAEDYVREAESNPDPRTKATLYLQAAVKAAQAGDSERAIRHADRVPEGSRTKQWNFIRLTITTQAAIAAFREGNVRGMQQILLDTPPTIRPYTQIQTAERLASTGNLNTALQLATDAKNALEHSKHPDVAAYIELANAFAALAPEALPGILKKTIELLNELAENRGSLSPFMELDPSGFVPFRLASGLLEADPRLDQSARRIRDPHLQLRFLLGLLNSALEKARNRPCCELPPTATN